MPTRFGLPVEQREMAIGGCRCKDEDEEEKELEVAVLLVAMALDHTRFSVYIHASADVKHSQPCAGDDGS
jgi:hypothetical protein